MDRLYAPVEALCQMGHAFVGQDHRDAALVSNCTSPIHQRPLFKPIDCVCEPSGGYSYVPADFLQVYRSHAISHQVCENRQITRRQACWAEIHRKAATQFGPLTDDAKHKKQVLQLVVAKGWKCDRRMLTAFQAYGKDIRRFHGLVLHVKVELMRFWDFPGLGQTAARS